MIANVFSWKKLFFFCFGLLLASMFCMKWMESEFIHDEKLFSIMDLELYLNKADLGKLLTGLDDKTRTIVGYHLHFDFLFMAGVFPGLACICMMMRNKCRNNIMSSLLWLFALLQFVAWGFDIYENLHLIKWLNDPASIDGVDLYHLLVRLKFIIVFGALLVSLIAFLFFRKKTTNIQS
jgi:hypothetical protein